MASVVFSMFDQSMGPVALFSTIPNEILTKKVAVKSIVSTLTNVQGIQANQIQGEAIIPLPQENLMSFISYATLVHKTAGGENVVISLTILVPADNPSLLYRNATTLSQKARELKTVLDTKFKPGSAISEEVKNAIRQWAGIVDQTVEPVAIPEIQELRESKGLMKLFKLLPPKKSLRKSADPVAYGFFSLLANIPLLLVGENVELMLMLAEIFQNTISAEEREVGVEQVEVEDVVFWQIGEVATDAYLFKSKSDITILNNEEYKRATFYKDPAIVIRLEEDIRTVNFDPEKDSIKALTAITSKARSHDDEGVVSNYLQVELHRFRSRLESLKTFIEKKGTAGLKVLAKQYDVDTSYIVLLAETILHRKLIKAKLIDAGLNQEVNFRKF